MPSPARWTASLRRLPALSIRQPYAWLVVDGFKDIENRSRRIRYRGSLLIHASLNESELYEDLVAREGRRARTTMPEDFPTGGIVGIVDVVDCVRRHPSPWKARGSWGWVLANARPLRFKPCKGAVGLLNQAAARRRGADVVIKW